MEPVKEMSGTSGWRTRALPALGPVPNTMLTTPGGTPAHRVMGSSVGVLLCDCCRMGDVGLPACSISLHSIQAVTEVISLGLATTVFPAAMAGAIFQVSRYRGRFQGLIRPAANTKHTHMEETGGRGGTPRSPCREAELTHSHRAPDGVVQAAHVVHLAALGQVMERRGGEEAEVMGRAGDVHGPGKGHRFTWKVTGYSGNELTHRSVSPNHV